MTQMSQDEHRRTAEDLATVSVEHIRMAELQFTQRGSVDEVVFHLGMSTSLARVGQIHATLAATLSTGHEQSAGN